MPPVPETEEETIEGLTDDQIKEARKGYVPLDRLNEATGKVRDENAQLRESLSALQATVQGLQQQVQHTGQSQQQETQEYTRAQLKEYVSSGQITQDQADDVWDKQQERKWENRLQQEVSKVKEETQTGTNLQGLRSTIGQYRELMPDISPGKSSENRDKLITEFERLTKVLGVPAKDSVEDFKLQVLALENVFGSVNTARSRVSRQQSSSDDAEIMEDMPSQAVAVPAGSKVLKNLSADKKQYYQRKIDRGVYKNWSDVEKELTWQRKKR